MATYSKADGTIKHVEPKNGTDFSLEELQGYVGGYIEIVVLPSGQFLVVNEEGIIHGLPLNVYASAIAYQPIVGDVLQCKSSEIK